MTSQEKNVLLDKEQTKYMYSEKDTDTSQSKKGQPVAKIPTKGSLEKVEEDIDKEKMEEKAYKAACPDYFGVKSYLHNFYDAHFYKDPNIYEEEDDEFEYLLHRKPHRRLCTSIWWKVFVWIGANFLIFGIIGVLVGYLVPQRPVFVGKITEGLAIVDRKAMAFNFNLNVCKLVGLILFCIGGLTLTVALLFPSFLYQYCDDDGGGRDSSFRVRMTEDEEGPRSPLEMTIPSCSMLSNVQPERKADESIVTQEGMISIKE